jgi:hypothetical protein
VNAEFQPEYQSLLTSAATIEGDAERWRALFKVNIRASSRRLLPSGVMLDALMRLLNPDTRASSRRLLRARRVMLNVAGKFERKYQSLLTSAATIGWG